MKELFLPPELFQELGEIYAAMEQEYDQVARDVGLTCHGCPDNCCDSYFLHHTYSEWAFLWIGLRRLDDDLFDVIQQRAREYVDNSKESLAREEQPRLMCPLNENGLCLLYDHRMLICRMHGVPAKLVRPDGQHLRFPGCFRCQEIVSKNFSAENEVPAMDRTVLFRRLVQLESRLLGQQRHLYPKVRLSIAEMIVKGPPRVKKRVCEQDGA